VLLQASIKPGRWRKARKGKIKNTHSAPSQFVVTSGGWAPFEKVEAVTRHSNPCLFSRSRSRSLGFSSRNALFAHLRESGHDKDKDEEEDYKLKCRKCKRAFSTRNDFFSHIREQEHDVWLRLRSGLRRMGDVEDSRIHSTSSSTWMLVLETLVVLLVRTVLTDRT
jgi:hypothetical protein